MNVTLVHVLILYIVLFIVYIFYSTVFVIIVIFIVTSVKIVLKSTYKYLCFQRFVYDFDILLLVQLTLGKVNILTNTFIIAWIVLEYTLCFSKWVTHNIIYKYIKKYILPVYEELCCPAGF